MNKLDSLNKILNILEATKTFEDIANSDTRFSQESVFDILIGPLCNTIGAENFEWHHGISKVMLYFPEILPTHIIKIPFNWYADYEDDEEYPYKNDYCQLECEVYQNAIIDGVEEILLKEVCCGYIQGVPVYIQRKADCTSYAEKESFSPSKEEINDFKNTVSDRNDYYKYSSATEDDEWNINVCEYFGYERGLELLRWIYDNLSDMHSGNVGYLANGQPVIFDYSGVDC